MPIIYLIMGMYDSLSFASNDYNNLPFTEEMVKLGLKDLNNNSFQTKDLDSVLAEYFIQNSRLYIKKWKTEEWVEQDRLGKFSLGGYLKRDDPYFVDYNHHGIIYVYNYIDDLEGKFDCWVEFKLTFSEGILIKTELQKFEKKDNTERKDQEKAFLEKIEIENNKFINKYFFHLPSVLYTRRLLSRLLYKIGTFITAFSYKL